MSYNISQTPTIDEVVVKALNLIVVSPEIHPLTCLEIIKESINEVLNPDMVTDSSSETTKYYKNFSPNVLKAALRLIDKRIAYAEALDEYLYTLYQESVGKNYEMTPHSQVETTPRFNFEALDSHLNFFLLQDITQGPDQGTNGQMATEAAVTTTRTTVREGRNVLEKKVTSANVTSFLIAERFVTLEKYRNKSNGKLNISALSTEVQLYASEKYQSAPGQSDSSIRDRLKAGRNILHGTDQEN